MADVRPMGCRWALSIPRGSGMCNCDRCNSRREAASAAERTFAPGYVPTYKTPLVPDSAPDHAVRVDMDVHADYHQEKP